MKRVADFMVRQEKPDEFLVQHLEIECRRLQGLGLPLHQIDQELKAIARTVNTMAVKIRMAQA